MRNVIQLKKASAVEVGEHALSPQHGTGILLAHEVTKNESIDGGKLVEIETGGTGEAQVKRLHVVGANDIVAVVL